jgi:hypothetical protein
MVDKLFLFLLPLGPTIFADLTADLLTKFRRYRSVAKRLALLPAFRAFKFIAAK